MVFHGIPSSYLYACELTQPSTLIKEASFGSGWWWIGTHNCPTAGHKKTAERSALNGNLLCHSLWKPQDWSWNREQKDYKEPGWKKMRQNRVSGHDRKVAHTILRHLWLNQACQIEAWMGWKLLNSHPSLRSYRQLIASLGGGGISLISCSRSGERPHTHVHSGTMRNKWALKRRMKLREKV